MRSTLRPLGVGEMLDRAVTLSVRFFVPLAIVWAAFLVPLSVLGYFATADSERIFTQMIDQVMRGASSAHQGAVAQEVARQSPFTALTAWYLVVFLIGYPLATAALLRSASEAYLAGHAAAIGPAYRDGVRQWLPLLGIVLIWIALAACLYVAAVLAAVVVALLVALITAWLKVVGIALAVVAAFVGIAIVVFAFTLAFLAFEVACMTQIVERSGFIRAFAGGLARVVRTPGRSLALGLALFAVNLVITIIASSGQLLLSGLTRLHVLGVTFGIGIGLAGGVLSAALTVVYYYDLRVRTEGFDLQQLVTHSEDAAATA